MNRALNRLKKFARQPVRKQPVIPGWTPREPAGDPPEAALKEDIRRLAEIHGVLSPYWSSRFER